MGVQTLRQSSDCLFIFTKGLSRSTVKPIQKEKKLKSSNFAKLLCFRNVNIERLKEVKRKRRKTMIRKYLDKISKILL